MLKPAKTNAKCSHFHSAFVWVPFNSVTRCTRKIGNNTFGPTGGRKGAALVIIFRGEHILTNDLCLTTH